MIFNNANIQFIEKELTQTSYTTTKTLPIIKNVKLIAKKKFAKTALDKNIEAFIIYILSLNLGSILIYPAKKIQITLLLIKKS